MQSKLLSLDSLAMKRLSITDSSLIFKIETSIRFKEEKDYEEGIFFNTK